MAAAASDRASHVAGREARPTMPVPAHDPTAAPAITAASVAANA